MPKLESQNVSYDFDSVFSALLNVVETDYACIDAHTVL